MEEKSKPNNKVGRPSSYKEEYADLAFNYCLLGAKDDDLAIFFDTSEVTINSWKQKHPEFVKSLKRGKEQADAKVASSLYHRAKGVFINTQQAIKLKDVKYIKGNRIETERIEIVELKQEQAPDTTAAIFWLKNRNPKNWRDRQNLEVTGKNGKDLLPEPILIEVIDSRDKVEKVDNGKDTNFNSL